MVNRNKAGAVSGKGRQSGGKPKSVKAKRGTNDDTFDLTKLKTSIPAHLDEDIDDDMAFNSEDEAMYGQFFKGNAKKAKKDAKKKGKKGGADDYENDGYDSDDFEDIGQEFDKLGKGDDMFPEDFSDDSRDEFDLSEMLDSKETRKKKTKERRDSRQKGPRQDVTNEEESMFSTSARAKKGTTAVTLDDLLNATDSAAGNRLKEATANKSTLMTRDVSEHVKEKTGRELTRDAVKKDLKKYTPVLKEMKKARVQAFPLKAPGHNAVPTSLGGIASAAQETGAAKPTTMQAKMADLLQQSGLSRSHQQQDEQAVAEGDLPENKKSFLGFSENDFEGVEGKTGADGAPSKSYMAKLKAMINYEAVKRRRFNRIKSKTYRRILRKEKEHEKERRDKAFELLNPEAARAKLQEKMERTRAIERATQKHKNTSKWVKHVKGIAKYDDDTKGAIDDQLAMHRKLMQKMDADAGEELMALVEDESESEEEDKRVDDLLAGAPKGSVLWGNEGEKNEGDDGDDGLDPSNPLTKARRELNAMGFMKKAKARHGEQMATELADLQEDIARYQQGLEPLHYNEEDEKKANVDEDNVDADVLAEDKAEGKAATKRHSLLKKSEAASGAKRKRGGTALNEDENSLLKRTSAHGGEGGRKAFGAGKTLQGGGAKTVESNLPGAAGLKSGDQIENSDDDNEYWGDVEEGEEHNNHAFEENESFSDADDEKEDESAALAKKRKKAEETAETTEEGYSTASVIPTKKKALGPGRKLLLPKRITVEDEEAQPEGADVENADEVSNDENRESFDETYQQDALIARAFAKDDIDEDFLKQKEQQVENIMKPQDKNATLPGWGEWGGDDEKLNVKHKAKVEKMELARNVEKSTLMSARADAKLDHVIINHDVDIVPGKYQLKMVPRPFSNAKEFSRSMRQPMGPEWNTASTFRHGAQPKIQTKQGTIIEPLNLSNHANKKPKTTRRKKESDQ